MVQLIENVTDFIRALGKEDQGKVVIIDFYADWCVPCKKISPAFEALAEKYDDCSFYKINVDNDGTKSICAVCEISSLPSFLIFCGSKYITRTLGTNLDEIEQGISQVRKQGILQRISKRQKQDKQDEQDYD